MAENIQADNDAIEAKRAAIAADMARRGMANGSEFQYSDLQCALRNNCQSVLVTLGKLFIATENEISAKIALEDAEANLYSNKVEGSNQEQRDAVVYVRTKQERQLLQQAQNDKRAAELEHGKALVIERGLERELILAQICPRGY